MSDHLEPTAIQYPVLEIPDESGHNKVKGALIKIEPQLPFNTWRMVCER